MTGKIYLSFKIENAVKFSIIVLGITSIITQIILLREFLTVFYGNELVIGIIFTNWMLLTGLGAFLGKYTGLIKNKIIIIVIFQVLVALLPIITVFLLSALRNIIFPVGAMLSLSEVFLSSFVLLLPYCILSGLLFTVFSTFISEQLKSNLINKVYSLDAIGSIIGGFLFNFFMIYFLTTFQSLFFLMIINFLIALLLSFFLKKYFPGILIFLIAVIFILINFKYDLDIISKQLLYKNQDIIFQRETPFGNLLVTKTSDQLNFIENGVPLFSTNNIIENEEAVHYAMIQHTDPKNILLVSGGISGILDEILKYNINRIDYLEINPWLIKIGKKYKGVPENDKINIINKDARLFVKENDFIYDVVLINLPEPSTAQINRYYTLEFFKELKEKLSKKAIISISLASTENYLSEEAIRLNSTLFNTLKKVFENIVIVPGGKNYFLASDGNISINIAGKIEKQGIKNSFVNKYYINDELLSFRSDFITNSLDNKAPVNRDFLPISYYNQLLLWISYFKINILYFAVALLLILIILLFVLKPVNLGLFGGGFAASSIEVILLISFQIIYGYVYQMIGIIIMIFMAGLAIGSLYMKKIIPVFNINNYIKVQISIAIFSILLPFILLLMDLIKTNSVIVHSVFFLLTLLIAILTGMQFALASKIQKKNISSAAAESYSSDLLGSAFGALLTSAFLIPLLGIIKVGIVLGLLNILITVIILLKRKRYLVSL